MKHCAPYAFLAAVLVMVAGEYGLAQPLFSIRPVIGGITSGAGFAAGVELRRSGVRFKAVGSVKKYQLLELGYEVPELGRRWLSFGISGRYRNFPQEDFWGLGPDTKEDQRANYLYEDISTTATLGINLGKIRTGMSGGYMTINTGDGRDKRYPSVPEALQTGPVYRPIGSFVEYDSLNEASDPRAGGKYSMRWTRYGNTFQQYEMEAKRFIPVRTDDRVALRAKTIFTDPSASQVPPFFMLPVVGGGATVRGFSQGRFRDRNALILNAEYRRPVASFLDAVLFADAGKVFSRASEISLTNMATAGGLGARVKLGKRMFFGVDLGFSREGQHLFLRSEHMF